MRLPFVSRATYDDVRADLARAAEQVAKLTQVIIDLKVTGATVRQYTNQSPGLKLERKPASKIEQALDSNPRTRRVPALRSRMLTWAEEQIEAGKDEEYVLEYLENWNRVPSDDEEDEDEESVA